MVKFLGLLAPANSPKDMCQRKLSDINSVYTPFSNLNSHL